MPPHESLIGSNLAEIRERIAQAAARAGRTADDITLVAVSKTFPPEAIRSAYELGLRHFGENRVQEWEGKLGAKVGAGGAFLSVYKRPSCPSSNWVDPTGHNWAGGGQR